MFYFNISYLLQLLRKFDQYQFLDMLFACIINMDMTRLNGSLVEFVFLDMGYNEHISKDGKNLHLLLLGLSKNNARKFLRKLLMHNVLPIIIILKVFTS